MLSVALTCSRNCPRGCPRAYVRIAYENATRLDGIGYRFWASTQPSRTSDAAPFRPERERVRSAQGEDVLVLSRLPSDSAGGCRAQLSSGELLHSPASCTLALSDARDSADERGALGCDDRGDSLPKRCTVTAKGEVNRRATDGAPDRGAVRHRAAGRLKARRRLSLSDTARGWPEWVAMRHDATGTRTP